jgi:FkbH-like protein
VVKRTLNITMIGDVITPPLARFGDALQGFDVVANHGDFGQIMPFLLGNCTSDAVILHTSDAWFDPDEAGEDPLGRARQFAAAAVDFANRNKVLTILNTVSGHRDQLVGRDHIAAARRLAAINECLFAASDASLFISIADVAGVVADLGRAASLTLQNYHVMRMPYTRAAAAAIGTLYGRHIRERLMPRKKVLVLDADNTLWGGVIGEDGIDGIEIGSEYPGSVFRDFQRQLLRARDGGILLCLVSKNDHAEVATAFATRAMPLALTDFTVARINWQPKSANIQAIAQALNVGLDTMVFIDDNPFELGEVGAALPDVACYSFDGRNAGAALGLLPQIADLQCWDVTTEDRAKAAQYAQESERAFLAEVASDIGSYIRSLEIEMTSWRNTPTLIKRIAQLTNKTNQFNLTTRRYSEADIARLMAEADVFAYGVRDRFGDMGIVGVVIAVDGAIDTCLMSCRALGRGIESNMLAHAVRHATTTVTRAFYRRTAKNDMVADFYGRHGFEADGVAEDGALAFRLAGPIATDYQLDIKDGR